MVAFYHACLVFPVKDSWLDAIKAGNCDTFDGLTHSNVARYCPDFDETILGHLAQTWQNFCSLKPSKPPSTAKPPLKPLTPPNDASREVFIQVYPISKLYLDDTGRFPVCARLGNQYIMIAYHMEGNLILQQAFPTKADKHCIPAFNVIMTRLTARRLSVDLNIRDNEASADFKRVITKTWRAKFQLVLPDMHRRNKAKQMIGHFKNHFLLILASINAAYPPYLWDLLLPQAELTINLLRKAAANPNISAWEYFTGPFNFNKTPLAPVGCRILIHAKPGTRRSWDYRAKQGSYVGSALNHYRCYKLVKLEMKQTVISDTVQFRHAYLQIPAVSAEDKILNGLQVMVGTLQNAPPPTSSSQ